MSNFIVGVAAGTLVKALYDKQFTDSSLNSYTEMKHQLLVEMNKNKLLNESLFSTEVTLAKVIDNYSRLIYSKDNLEDSNEKGLLAQLRIFDFTVDKPHYLTNSRGVSFVNGHLSFKRFPSAKPYKGPIVLEGLVRPTVDHPLLIQGPIAKSLSLGHNPNIEGVIIVFNPSDSTMKIEFKGDKDHLSFSQLYKNVYVVQCQGEKVINFNFKEGSNYDIIQILEF